MNRPRFHELGEKGISGRLWLRGAAVLGAAALLSRLIGTLQKIPLQNVGGDEVYAIFSLVYPLYTMMLFVATAGIPLAVSVFVAEAEFEGNCKKSQSLLRFALASLALIGALAFAFVYVASAYITHWIGHEAVDLSVRALAFAFLVAPVTGGLRGYYQGQKKMVPAAVSQLTEQSVRVAALLAALFYLAAAGADSETIAAGAMFASFVGGLAGLAVMLAYWQYGRRKNGRANTGAQTNQTTLFGTLQGYDRRPLWKMAVYSIPLSLGTMAVPVLSLVDTFTLPRLLAQAAGDATEALRQFGVYARGIPLIQLVALLFGSMAAAMVPAWTEARLAHDAGFSAKGQRTEPQVFQALRFTWLIALAAAAGLAILAVPVNGMLFANTEGSAMIAVMAAAILFSSLQITASAVLQSQGNLYLPLVGLMLAAACKALLHAGWVPAFGGMGAAMATVAGYALGAGWSLLFALRMQAPGVLAAAFVSLRKSVLSVIIMALALFLWLKMAHIFGYNGESSPRGAHALLALPGVFLGAGVYGWCLLRFGEVKPEELRRVPRVGAKLAQWAGSIKRRNHHG